LAFTKEEPVASVLVIEDDTDVRDLLALVLRDAGHVVQTARDGLEGMAVLLKSPHPLVVLLDLLMPRISGEVFLHLVAEGTAALARHAYILVTALARTLPHDLFQLLKRVDVPLVAKPFDIDTIVTAVDVAGAGLRVRAYVR
jgi:two-component system nitrogen regulation response regulator GlnG